MTKVAVLIIGLPGSGKTHYLCEHMSGYTIIDDPKLKQDITQHFQHDKLAIADPNLCFERVRTNALKMLEAAGYDVRFICFENDTVACLNNVRHRATTGDERKVDYFIRYLSKDYTIPAAATVLKVWQSGEIV